MNHQKLLTCFKKSFETEALFAPTLRNFSDILKKETDFFSLGQEIGRYADFRQSLTDNSSGLISYSKEIVNKCFVHLLTAFPDLQIRVEGRLKGFISYLSKVILLADEGKPFVNLPDLLGIRLIITAKDEVEEIALCYKITKSIIDFLTSELDCKLTNSLPVKNISTNYVGLLPTKENLNEISNYSSYIKDYINSPKNNGYRSIHFLIWVPSLGQFIEFQVRSFLMHAHAELDVSAAHGKYKATRYSTPEVSSFLDEISNCNIKTYGFISTNDNTYDIIGFNSPWYITIMSN